MKNADIFYHNNTKFIICDIHEGIVYAERWRDGRFTTFTVEQVEQDMKQPNNNTTL